MTQNKEKSVKITDVTKPGHQAPAPTSRPVIASRSIAVNDPMVVSSPQDALSPASDDNRQTAPLVSRQAKEIVPPTEAQEDTVAGLEQPAPVEAASEAVPSSAEPGAHGSQNKSHIWNTDPPALVPSHQKTIEPPQGTISPEEPSITEDHAPASERDFSATGAASQTEDAKQKLAAHDRTAELEQLIASRKYVVPINSVEQKRSQFVTALLGLLVIILAAILIDLLLDANLIELIQKLPHTHFFSS